MERQKMKLTIGIVGALGLLFLGFGYFTGKSENADKAFSAIIPYMIGGFLLAGDVALTAGYAAYRLFTG